MIEIFHLQCTWKLTCYLRLVAFEVEVLCEDLSELMRKVGEVGIILGIVFSLAYGLSPESLKEGGGISGILRY